MYNVDKLEDINEEWKIYPEISSIEVSNFGNIRDNVSKEILSLYNSHGYLMIFRNNKHYSVHRLVAELFVKNSYPEKYFYVNHIDGNKSNNIFYNLEWCNISMNTQHAILTGLQESHSYDIETIENICKLLSQGLPQFKISIITGVNRKYISDIYRRRRHKNISINYKFNKKFHYQNYIIKMLLNHL